MISMPQQNKQRLKTEQQFNFFIETIIKKVSRERLLPKLIWNASKEFGNRKMIDYQQSVKKEYAFQLKSPTKYNPEEAKSGREKFRQKVMQAMKNELEIDYCQHVKGKNKSVATFNGHALEEKKVPIKKQFEIFSNFNEKRFKETYANMFQDKLEIRLQQVYSLKNNNKCKTVAINDPPIQRKDQQPIQRKDQQPIIHNQEKHHSTAIKTQSTPFEKSNTYTLKSLKKTDIVKTKMEEPLQKMHGSRQKAPRSAAMYFNENLTVGKELKQIDVEEEALRIMCRIGKYCEKTKKEEMWLTKESMIKYFRGLYEKPLRLVDFLQIPEVVSFQEFCRIPHRLRVMPQDHLLFMAFLYYDTNNDGYICDYDLQKIASLAETRPLLQHDYTKIKKHGFKKILSKKQPYLDLYKRPQITETTYFQFTKSQKQHHSNLIQSEQREVQIKNFLQKFKQKTIFLDFEAFSRIFNSQKPFIWYDLMHKLNGIMFQGIKYE